MMKNFKDIIYSIIIMSFRTPQNSKKTNFYLKPKLVSAETRLGFQMNLIAGI